MASDLISQIASLYFRGRIEEMNDYRLNASDIQSEQLFNLLREAEGTSLSKKYDFRSIVSYQEFRERVPLLSAETIKPFIQRIENGEVNVLWPGLPKRIFPSFNETRIPISDQAITETFIQGIYDGYAIHLRLHPESRLFGGFFLTVGNDPELPLIDELDQFLKGNEPFINSLLNIPKHIGTKQQLAEINASQLIKEIGPNKISCFKGTPKALEQLINATRNEDGTLASFLTDAELLFHKTTMLSSLLKEMKQAVNLPIPIQSAYCTPEGFVGIQDNPGDDSFMLMLDLSTFYEFIPTDRTNSQPMPLEDVEVNRDYQLVLTNCSGLWRYLSDGPKLRFVSVKPYRFLLV